MAKFILKPPAWPRLTVQTSSETALNAPGLEGRGRKGAWAEPSMGARSALGTESQSSGLRGTLSTPPHPAQKPALLRSSRAPRYCLLQLMAIVTQTRRHLPSRLDGEESWPRFLTSRPPTTAFSSIVPFTTLKAQISSGLTLSSLCSGTQGHPYPSQ